LAHTFNDSAGAEWHVSVTVATVKRVRTLTDVDLLRVQDGQIFHQLGSDPILLVDVLYAVCKPTVDTLGLTDEQFGERLAGDAIAEASTALMKALVDFFPERQTREALTRVLAKGQEIESEAARRLVRGVDEGLEKIDVGGEAERLIRGESSGDARA